MLIRACMVNRSNTVCDFDELVQNIDDMMAVAEKKFHNF